LFLFKKLLSAYDETVFLQHDMLVYAKHTVHMIPSQQNDNKIKKRKEVRTPAAFIIPRMRLGDIWVPYGKPNT